MILRHAQVCPLCLSPLVVDEPHVLAEVEQEARDVSDVEEQLYENREYGVDTCPKDDDAVLLLETSPDVMRDRHATRDSVLPQLLLQTGAHLVVTESAVSPYMNT